MSWLFKEEPTNYSYDALARDGKTTWTGVRNPLAQKHLERWPRAIASSSTTPAERNPSSAS